MENIVVPLDFSDASFNAANFAASLANVFKSNLIVVHAYLNPGAIDKMPNELLNDIDKGLQEVKEDLMNEYIEILRKKYTIKIEGMVKEKNASALIQQVAKKYHASLIVMGARGKGNSKLLYGSTTNIVIRKSSIPVLIIPQNATYKSIEAITIATDFRHKTSSNNFSLLETFVKTYNARLQILNVSKNNQEISKIEALEKSKLAAAFTNLKFQFYTIENVDIDAGIETFLLSHPSEMLVMVARKHNLYERLFVMSHTKEMRNETRIPLLILQEK